MVEMTSLSSLMQPHTVDSRCADSAVTEVPAAVLGWSSAKSCSRLKSRSSRLRNGHTGQPLRVLPVML